MLRLVFVLLFPVRPPQDRSEGYIADKGEGYTADKSEGYVADRSEDSHRIPTAFHANSNTSPERVQTNEWNH